MLEQSARNGRRSSLTGLLLALADRCLVLPNVAVAELIGYQAGTPAPEQPDWMLGWIDWRNQRLPLLSFEAACGGQLRVGERARIVVLNALGAAVCASLPCWCRAFRAHASSTASSTTSMYPWLRWNWRQCRSAIRSPGCPTCQPLNSCWKTPGWFETFAWVG